jgi:kinesin family protein 3/17
MCAMVSPSTDAFQESISTLKFATRAKRIKNTVKVNDYDLKSLIRKNVIELSKLKQELQLRYRPKSSALSSSEV